MFLVILIMNNIENYSTIKEKINWADAVVIWAGAGLSTSAWIEYWEKNFKESFPELVENYWFTDMYTSSFYEFKTEEERWSYWAKHINYLCTWVEAKQLYKNLYEIFKDKNYYIISTNVDEQFIKAWFDSDKVFQIQGSLSKIQCSRACHNKLYDDTALVKEMLEKNEWIKVPTELVPYCPNCWEKMEINLRKDQYFIQDNNWYKHNESYNKFIVNNKDKNIVFLELWVWYNTPWIIRYPFENYTYHFSNAYLIRNNYDYAEVPRDLD